MDEHAPQFAPAHLVPLRELLEEWGRARHERDAVPLPPPGVAFDEQSWARLQQIEAQLFDIEHRLKLELSTLLETLHGDELRSMLHKAGWTARRCWPSAPPGRTFNTRGEEAYIPVELARLRGDW